MAVVVRCAICAAPLRETRTAVAVTCPYCGSENLLRSEQAAALGEKAARLGQASAESRAMQPDIDARVEELTAAMTTAVERGDYPSALRCQEGVLRLSYAPVIHLYSYDPDDSQAAGALEEIDRAIDTALQDLAAGWGVPYVPARDRS